MISIDKSILLSIRGFGVSKIEKTSKEETYRSEDAQDVLFYKKEQIIIVADGIEGLVIFKCREKKPEIKLPLPNYDIPQEIKHFYNHVLIKGKNGLYLLNLNTNKFRVIMEGGVGAFTQYYNYIFYSSNSQIHLLVSSEKGLSEFTLYDEKELDIKRNKYLR